MKKNKPPFENFNYAGDESDVYGSGRISIDSKETPRYIQIFVDRNFEIIDKIDVRLKEMQKDRFWLSQRLNVEEDELNIKLSGLEDLTLMMISKIEAILEIIILK